MLGNLKISFWQRLSPRILHSVVWYPTKFLLYFFMHMELEIEKGFSNKIRNAVKNKRPILYISNHISEFDPIISTMATSPFSPAFPLFWVARPGRYYKDPDFSWRKYIYGDLFFILWGAQPLISGYNDYQKSLARHIWLLKNGYTVCIFPQGGISKNKYGGGAGYLVKKFNPLLVRLHISGIENINSREFWTRKRHLKVKFEIVDNAKEMIDNTLAVPDRYKKFAKDILKDN